MIIYNKSGLKFIVMISKKDSIGAVIPGLFTIVFYLVFSGSIQSQVLSENGKYRADSSGFNKSPVIKSSSGDGRDTLLGPGPIIENPYSQEQDSAYLRAMELKIPTERRLINDFRMYMGYFTPEINKEETIWDAYERAFRIPQTVYMPLSVEMVQRYEAIQRSQHVDGINSMPKVGMGAQISLEAIGMFFGVVEDVTPVIKYELTQRAEVEILIYSIQARLVRTVYKSVVAPGKYEITWNYRDDSGMKVPQGDYIAEIRIGKDRLKVKRIRVQ